MRFLLAAIVLVATASLPTSALADSGSSARDEHAVRYYLSLGDSLAAGEQLPSDQNFGDHGYADQLWAIERESIPTLKLVKLGCGGETTSSMIDAVRSVPQGLYEGRGNRFFCNFPHGSQLGDAVAFLHAHHGSVAFVTLDIGANDVTSPTAGGVDAVVANLPLILAALREAAGPEVPIVGMSYYQPFLVSWFSDPASLQPSIDGIVGFNHLLASIYGAAGDPVADVEGAFSTTETTPQPDGVPLDVERICAWTWLCDAGVIHPNATGYAVIAQAFASALP